MRPQIVLIGVALAVAGYALSSLAEEPRDPSTPKIATPSKLYTCPTHPQIRWTRPDDCPICGMKLEPNAGNGKRQKVYTCPMHPQIQRPKPGKCPLCGMRLALKDANRTDGAAGTPNEHEGMPLNAQGQAYPNHGDMPVQNGNMEGNGHMAPRMNGMEDMMDCGCPACMDMMDADGMNGLPPRPESRGMYYGRPRTPWGSRGLRGRGCGC